MKFITRSLKKLSDKINAMFKWMSRDTMDAINSGATYEEVRARVEGSNNEG